VATLLGQPKINLTKCRLGSEGDKTWFISVDGSIRLPVSPEIRQRVLRSNLDEVVVGIRPFHMTVVSHEERDDTILNGIVYVYERLGTKGILTLNIGSGRFDVITPISMDFNIDDSEMIKVDVNELIVFDPATTKNILID
jgi:ABC-type sugar transport system ATPase subunit